MKIVADLSIRKLLFHILVDKVDNLISIWITQLSHFIRKNYLIQAWWVADTNFSFSISLLGDTLLPFLFRMVLWQIIQTPFFRWGLFLSRLNFRFIDWLWGLFILMIRKYRVTCRNILNADLFLELNWGRWDWNLIRFQKLDFFVFNCNFLFQFFKFSFKLISLLFQFMFFLIA